MKKSERKRLVGILDRLQKDELTFPSLDDMVDNVTELFDDNLDEWIFKNERGKMKEWLRQRILYILDAQRKMENKK